MKHRHPDPPADICVFLFQQSTSYFPSRSGTVINPDYFTASLGLIQVKHLTASRLINGCLMKQYNNPKRRSFFSFSHRSTPTPSIFTKWESAINNQWILSLITHESDSLSRCMEHFLFRINDFHFWQQWVCVSEDGIRFFLLWWDSNPFFTFRESGHASPTWKILLQLKAAVTARALVGFLMCSDLCHLRSTNGVKECPLGHQQERL